jgi:FHA domain
MSLDCHRLAERLERARLLKRWSEVLAVTQQLSQLSAESVANGFDTGKGPNVLPLRPTARTRSAPWLQKWWRVAFPAGHAKKAESVNHADDQTRFLLWVDSVGGYLVCTGNEVVLGQPVPGSQIDVPIRGDLSRRHAVVRRDGEGYLLEPVREAAINGKALERPALLRDGDQITLGDSVQLRFRRPHPLSQTARLEFLSYHRTQPATDGVLLLAESCVLGPGTASHIICPDWPHDVVLFRQNDSLGCRSPKPVKINDVEYRGRGQLAERSRVAGEGFSFSVEPA